MPSFLLSVNAAYNSEIEIDADIAYLISCDADSTVIYDKNSDQKMSPGAIVKIVTAILTIENCPDLDAVVTAEADPIRALDGTGATIAGILVGEQLTVRQLLYCLLVYNANDAANILASYVSGDSVRFAALMNDFAARLQCAGTHFANPTGFDDNGQYTTAKDLATIFRYCMSNSTFSDILSTTYYEIPATNKYDETRKLSTTNGLMNTGIPDYYFQYVKAGKSGITEDDKCNAVSMAVKDGYSYICVIMNADFKDFDQDKLEENMSLVCSKQLYAWTYDNIKLRVVANTSTYVWEEKVLLSKDYDYVSLVPAMEVSALVPSGVNAESVYIEPIKDSLPEQIKAPVKKGDIIGKAVIKYAGEKVAEVDLAAAFDVDRNFGKTIGYYLGIITHSLVFKILIFLAVCGVLFFIFILIKNSFRTSNHKNKIISIKKGEETHGRQN